MIKNRIHLRDPSVTRASAIQMCSSLSIDDNLKSAGHLLRVAADQGSRLAVLPEMFPIISTNAQDKIKYQEDVGSGKIQNFLQTQAQTLNLWIVGGTMPLRSAQGNRVRARVSLRCQWRRRCTLRQIAFI